LKQTQGYNTWQFEYAQERRLQLLSKLPDQFTPIQAMEAWKMSRAKTDLMTASMRQWKLIIPNEGKKGRIFTKVKEES
jgi:hypothetical protein